MHDDLHPDRLLDRRQVFELFGIPVRFLELAAGRREGPPIVRVGRLVRYRVADVQRWICDQTEPGSR